MLSYLRFLVIVVLLFGCSEAGDVEQRPVVVVEEAGERPVEREKSQWDLPLILPENAEVVDLALSEWPPYISAKLPNYGLHCYLVRKAFARAGIRVRYNFYPTWARAEEQARSGEDHGLFYAAETADRIRNFYSSETICLEERYFISLREKNFNWESVADLKGKSLAVLSGYYYGEELTGLVKSGDVENQVVKHEEHGLRKLLQGSVDAFPASLLVVNTALNRNKDLDAALFAYHPRPLIRLQHRMQLSRRYQGSERLIKLFNQAWKEMVLEMGSEVLLQPALAEDLSRLSESERGFFKALRTETAIEPGR